MDNSILNNGLSLNSVVKNFFTTARESSNTNKQIVISLESGEVRDIISLGLMKDRYSLKIIIKR